MSLKWNNWRVDKIEFNHIQILPSFSTAFNTGSIDQGDQRSVKYKIVQEKLILSTNEKRVLKEHKKNNISYDL